MSTLDLTAEIIDIRDVIARYEELESIKDNEGGTFNEVLSDDEEDEYKTIRTMLDDIQDCGGDEEWRDHWYPITLVRDDYFVDYAQDLVVDCGYIPADLPSWIAIDWDKTAEAVQEDYTLVTIGSEDYWYR